MRSKGAADSGLGLRGTRLSGFKIYRASMQFRAAWFRVDSVFLRTVDLVYSSGGKMF